jgi:hypothetical protein
VLCLTSACGEVRNDLGSAREAPGSPAARDAGVVPIRNRCHPDAGSAPSVREEIHYFIDFEGGTKQLPCGIYTFNYVGPTDRTSMENARVLFEHEGTALFSVGYDWRATVPFLDGPPYRMDFDGYFTLLINNADFPGPTDLWNLQANFDGKHVFIPD